MDGLGLPSSLDEPSLAQEREVLRQRRLAQIDAPVQFAHRHRPLQQVAEDQQALLVAERLEELRRLRHVPPHLLEHGLRSLGTGTATGGWRHARIVGWHVAHYISLLTNLAIANIVPLLP